MQKHSCPPRRVLGADVFRHCMLTAWLPAPSPHGCTFKLPIEHSWHSKHVLRSVHLRKSSPALSALAGKFNKHIDYWDAIKNQEFFSLEAFRHVLSQMLSMSKTPDLDGPKFQIMKKMAAYEIRRYDHPADTFQHGSVDHHMTLPGLLAVRCVVLMKALARALSAISRTSLNANGYKPEHLSQCTIYGWPCPASNHGKPMDPAAPCCDFWICLQADCMIIVLLVGIGQCVADFISGHVLCVARCPCRDREGD